MNAPMVLPWLARRWEVSDERALELWRQACLDAEIAMGKHSASNYWGYAKNRLIDLLDDEVLVRYPVSDTPWIMIRLNVLRIAAWFRCSISTGAAIPA